MLIYYKATKILFEDTNLKDQKQQIEFNGTPLVVLGSNNLDCTFATDHTISRKLKLKEKNRRGGNYFDL